MSEAEFNGYGDRLERHEPSEYIEFATLKEFVRDYFAGQALQGMFASDGHRRVFEEIKADKQAFCLSLGEIAAATNERVAVMAYDMADAMLAARDQKASAS